jgi:hypothetical protein
VLLVERGSVEAFETLQHAGAGAFEPLEAPCQAGLHPR